MISRRGHDVLASAFTACHPQAQSATNGEPSKTKEVLKGGGNGALSRAAVDAPGGVIVKGGEGAGKGAARTTASNMAKENDAAYKATYARCMRNRGYTI